VVVYTYMGVFPGSEEGARGLICDSARLARQAGCERLIVKTVAESRQIPSVDNNLEALQLAAQAADGVAEAFDPGAATYYQETLFEARSLIDAVLNLDADIGQALLKAFARGLLDIPYCLHADNPGRSTTRIDTDGALRWGSTGGLALPQSITQTRKGSAVTSTELLQMLSHMANRYDHPLQ
jgi:methylaspartate mutase epsilon subunit